MNTIIFSDAILETPYLQLIQWLAQVLYYLPETSGTTYTGIAHRSAIITVLGLGLGLDFTFAWDNNKKNKNKPRLTLCNPMIYWKTPRNNNWHELAAVHPVGVWAVNWQRRFLFSLLFVFFSVVYFFQRRNARIKKNILIES